MGPLSFMQSVVYRNFVCGAWLYTVVTKLCRSDIPPCPTTAKVKAVLVSWLLWFPEPHTAHDCEPVCLCLCLCLCLFWLQTAAEGGERYKRISHLAGLRHGQSAGGPATGERDEDDERLPQLLHNVTGKCHVAQVLTSQRHTTRADWQCCCRTHTRWTSATFAPLTSTSPCCDSWTPKTKPCNVS